MRGSTKIMTAVLAVRVAFLALGATEARAESLLAYPNRDKATFTVQLPDGWDVTPGESVGDYASVTGADTSATVWFRTMPGTSEAITGAVQETLRYIRDTYKDVKVDDAKDHTQNGLKGFVSSGSGLDKESGEPYLFGMGWFQMQDGTIAEIWFSVGKDDKAGQAAAGKVITSFRAP
jgi:hypothetical protein